MLLATAHLPSVLINHAQWLNLRVRLSGPCELSAILCSICRRAVEDFLDTGVMDEVSVVDNNSTDRTAEEASQTAARIVHESQDMVRHCIED